jgi:glycosyltransferase involved in cell wall biosynthesis
MSGQSRKVELERRAKAYESWRRRGFAELGRGSADDGLFWLCAAASLAWLYPFDKWRDPEIDRALAGAVPLPARGRIEPEPDKLTLLTSQVLDGGGHIELLLLMLESIRGFELSLISSEWADSKKNGARTLDALPFPALLCPRPLTPARKVAWVYQQLAQIRPCKIVLDTFPGDVFSAAACAMYRDDSGAEIMILDQGDTYFWCGASFVDRVLEWREAGASISYALRGIGPERIRVVPSTARERRSADVSRARLGVPEGATLSLTVAGFHKFKSDGHFDYPKTVRRLVEEHPGHYHMIVGHGGDEEGLRRQFDHDRVLWLGRRTDVDALLRVADFVLESFPLMGGMFRLDALCEGKPIAAISHPAFPLAFETGALPPGYPFLADSNEAILDHCRQLIRDAELRRRLGDALRQRYDEMFTRRLYEEALNEALEGGGRESPVSDEPLEYDAEWFATLLNPAPADLDEHLLLMKYVLDHTPTPNASEWIVGFRKRVRESIRYRIGV